MCKIKALIFLLTVGFASCKNSEAPINRLEIAKQYYRVLDTSDYSEITSWFADSLTIKEEGYEQRYSQNAYLMFLKWDATFDPSYKILEIEEEDGVINAKISKMDKRISFLLEEPFITDQVLRFQKDKIISVETDYVNFNEKNWEKNKSELLNWIDENHPELQGFLYDQSQAGGIKYLKAIELYKNSLENN